MKKALITLALACGVAGIALWPVTTRVGVNFVVTSHRLTLAEKTVHFVSRHWQTQRVAESVTSPGQGFEEKIERILAWVSENVRSVPEGFPIVDDHPLHIILRGYGASDQRTEAFTLLASYSGLPAGTVVLNAKGTRETTMLALVEWKGHLYPVDVQHNLLFRTPDGRLAHLAELMEHPQWIEAAAAGRINSGVPYAAYWEQIGSLEPSFARMRLQKPWSRFQATIQKALQLGVQRTK